MSIETETEWLVKGAGVTIRSIDDEGREVFDLATIAEISGDSIVLDSGEKLFGVIDLHAGMISVSTRNGSDTRWDGQMGVLPGGTSPSSHFSQKWKG